MKPRFLYHQVCKEGEYEIWQAAVGGYMEWAELEQKGIKPYYKDESVFIIHSDCRLVLPLIPDKSIDLVLTDPPYFLPAKHYETRRNFARSLGDLSILEYFFDATLKDCIRLLKGIGYLYLFCDGQSYPVFYVKLYSLVKALRPLIWDKMTSINGYSWRHQHELIIFAEMPEAQPVKTGDGDILRYRAEPIDDRKHPSQKPEDLISALLSKSLFESGIVLDPFLGSGTTLVCAKKLGRKAIGVEIEEKYCEIAAKRLSQSVMALNG